MTTPKELLDTGFAAQWIHGSDIGIDEEGNLWVRASAELSDELTPRLKPQPLGRPRITVRNFREYSILTPDGKTALNPRDRSEPVWKYVNSLESESIGSDWIPVDRREAERKRSDATVRTECVR